MMSNSYAKARRSRVKDERQSPAPDVGVGKKRNRKKVDKPWAVIGPELFSETNGKIPWGRFEKKDDAAHHCAKLDREFEGLGYHFYVSNC